MEVGGGAEENQENLARDSWGHGDIWLRGRVRIAAHWTGTFGGLQRLRDGRARELRTDSHSDRRRVADGYVEQLDQ